MATPILTALYLRASTDEQTESIAAQRLLLDRYAQDHQLQIVASYQDQGKTGDSFQQRQGLQQLLAAAKQGQFKLVLVRNLSRLSRRNSLKTAAQIINPLLDAGVGVCTASQGNLRLDTATGRIVLAVLSEMENSENASRAFNVLNGLLKAASQGYWVSSCPWGYHITGPKCKKELQLGDPQAIATIQRLFRLYTSGHSLRGIAKLLNSEGVGSPEGLKWYSQTIRQLLVNPVYCGDHRYNLRTRAKYYRLKSGTLVERQQHWRDDQDTVRSEYNSDADLICFPNRWPAVVSRKTWDTAQELLAKNRGNTAPHREFLFSTLLQCQCGGAMFGRQQRTGQKRYNCQGCGATVAEADLLKYVAQALQQQLGSPEQLAQLKQAVERQLRTAKQQPPTAIAGLQSRLQRYEKRLLEVSRDMLPTVEAEIRSLRQQLQEATRNQQIHNAYSKDIGQQVDRVLADFHSLPQALKRKAPGAVRTYLQQMLDRIEVRTEQLQGEQRKRYRLRGLLVCGAVKPDLSTPAYQPLRDALKFEVVCA